MDGAQSCPWRVPVGGRWFAQVALEAADKSAYPPLGMFEKLLTLL